MKKHILTCFLASLCLYGSTLLAQVADSPGADFLHRLRPTVSFGFGDTHRGGEIRSDTLPEKSGLVDHSGIKGQESEDSSAAVGGFFTLKGELSPNPHSGSSWSYRLSEREIDPYFKIAEVLSDSILVQRGDFYAGTSGKEVFELRIPVQEPFGRFTLKEGGKALIEDLWVQPGDSLLLHWDQKNGHLFFSGPDALQARIQMQLQAIARSEASKTNPVMILSNVDGMLNTPAKKERYGEAVSAYMPGWSRHMEWLDTDESRLARATGLFASASGLHPVFQELEREKDRLPAALYVWLKGYWTGILMKSPLEFIQIAKPGSAEWANLIMKHSREEDLAEEWDTWTFAPASLVESLYLEKKLLSDLLPVSFLHLTDSMPSPLQDQVNALFLIRNYKNMNQADSLFAAVLPTVQSPVIAQKLDGLYRSNLRGSDFPEFAFEDATGTKIYPDEWEGKLVFMDFWLSGCGACLSFAKENFFPLMEAFKDHRDVLFVTVSGDSRQELWKKSLASGKYTSDQSINLFSGGTDHPTLRQNMIRSFPAQLLLDREGKILQTGNFPDDTKGWIDLIDSYLPDSNSQHNLSDSKPKAQ
ncbi:TlpA family protein disulfide reductase [Algoriphagus resistens]|uniref:TlpA family protein disulfide reductase n=1 Tax=Algoriphagus resistens TaxID=1750590 RepID=UPI0007168CED|nr:hypothetical protein [Algoriphagus resistens]